MLESKLIVLRLKYLLPRLRQSTSTPWLLECWLGRSQFKPDWIIIFKNPDSKYFTDQHLL